MRYFKVRYHRYNCRVSYFTDAGLRKYVYYKVEAVDPDGAHRAAERAVTRDRRRRVAFIEDIDTRRDDIKAFEGRVLK